MFFRTIFRRKKVKRNKEEGKLRFIHEKKIFQVDSVIGARRKFGEYTITIEYLAVAKRLCVRETGSLAPTAHILSGRIHEIQECGTEN